MAVKRGLGKGLGEKGKGIMALIPGADEIVEETLKEVGKEGIVYLPIDKIEPNKNQPRKQFNEDTLNELSESIKQEGIINPILVREKDGYYEIIGGERRWRASKLAGISEIPVIIRALTDEEVAKIALIDNLQRENLNAIDEAKAYKQMMNDFGYTQDQVADIVSKSRVAITNCLRLLKLDGKIQTMIVEGMISQGHARAILALPEGIDPVSFAEKVFDEKLSVRETEKEIKNLQKKKKEKTPVKKNSQLEAVYGDLEEKLKNLLGTKVKINSKDDNKGSIEIEYYSQEQMADIIERLGA